MGVADERRDSAADRGRRVWHRADDRRARPEHGLKVPDRRAGGDGEKERRAVAERGEPGSASPIICGLTASTATAGSGGRSAFSRMPRSASSASRGPGLGSSTVIDEGGTPAREPALEKRCAHLAAAQQNQAAAGDFRKIDRPLPGPARPGSGPKFRRDRRLRSWRCQAPSPGSRPPRRRAGTPGRSARRPSPRHGPCR